MHLDAIVIGAGIAGLTAARTLTNAGLRVQVLEKSRGFGGRCATRRLDAPHGPLIADHGAQYFTARDARFQRDVDAWCEAGVTAVWTHDLATLGETPEGGRGAHPRYVAPDGMNALGKHLARGLTVAREATVTTIGAHESGYRVAGEGFAFTAPHVLVTAPVPQGLTLLDPALREAVRESDPLRSVTYHPCWALIIHAPHATAPTWRGLRTPTHPVIAWIANDASKRAAPTAGTTLVAHAHPAWSRAHLEEPADDIANALGHAAREITGLDLAGAQFAAHRWRYAQVQRAHPDRHALPHPGLAFAGDAFGGDDAGRIESAFTSALAAADALLAAR